MIIRRAPMARTSEAQYRSVRAANLDSAFFIGKAYAAALARAGQPGSLVFFSSVVAAVGVANHTAIADGQISGQTNYFMLVCADEAGNLTTNNNGGLLFKYVVPFVPPVLVVDAYFADLLDPPPPIENYTDTLDAIGLSYDVWDVESQGSPTAADLKAYRVVLWRIAEFSTANSTGLSSTQQSALRDYLNSGGALFIASMELISRLGLTSPFVHDVRPKKLPRVPPNSTPRSE